MKQFLLIFAVGFLLVASNQVFAQQGFGTNQPDKSAAVDIVSTKRGLLIPRVTLVGINNGTDPVSNPANSLLVYNVAGDLPVGYYYWDANAPKVEDTGNGRWVSFVSNLNQKTEVVEAGDNIKVEAEVEGNTTTYTVSVKEGTANNQLLVTKEISGSPGEYESVWVSALELLEDLFGAGNALAYDAENGVISFTGTLTESTTITTDGDDITLGFAGLLENEEADDVLVLDAGGILRKVSRAALVSEAIESGDVTAKTLTGDGITVTLTGDDPATTSVANSVLADVTLGIADGAITTDKIADGAVTTEKIEAGTEGQVLITVEDPDNPGQFITKWVDQSELEDNLVAENGLNRDNDDGNIRLGGALIEATTIEADATNTLAITGVQAGNAADRIVVQDAATGVLRQVVRSIKLPDATGGTYTVVSQTGYDATAQEIHIEAPTTADVSIALPEASAANIGQVINIKKTSTDEDYYVNISSTSGVDGSTAADAVYGALPYQSWIIKSDGATWRVIGRN